MTYYTAICMKCPQKRFIVPGTEYNNPRHEGKDGPALDAIHAALPENLRSDRAQMWMLACALELIRARVPVARYVDMETTDQDDYGFVLTGLRSTLGGPDLLPSWGDTDHPLQGVADEIGDQISDLDWDGVVGENEGGYVTIDITTSKVVHV